MNHMQTSKETSLKSTGHDLQLHNQHIHVLSQRRI